ncbi:hypothetical protein EV426DRAFT_577141 [Tirmania nivea]|nr:hypothetical protein EV426DRAFT_577141 [Tirmania nivea]
MSSEPSEQRSLGGGSSWSLANDETSSLLYGNRPRGYNHDQFSDASCAGIPAEALRLLAGDGAESPALPDTPRSLIRSDTTTLDSKSTYHLPTRDSEFEIEPTLDKSGDSITSTDSCLRAKPHASLAAVSPDKIEEKLALRPDDELRFVEYIFDPDAPININERQRRDGGILPTPGTRSHLPCPFKRLDGCEVMFDVREKKLWKFHSQGHFRDVKPPQKLICTFEGPKGLCGERFVIEDEKRLRNWRKKMEHLAKHYEDRLGSLSLEFDADPHLDADPNSDADMLSGVTDMPDEHFEAYVRRERRRLDDIVPQNHLPRSLGGPRYREVVIGNQNPHPEPHLDSGSAHYYIANERVNRKERIIAR